MFFVLLNRDDPGYLPVFDKKEEAQFNELRNALHSSGAVLVESDFLSSLAKDKIVQNHIHFLLVIGNDFTKKKEDENFRLRWIVDDNISKKVHGALGALYKSLTSNDIIAESVIVDAFRKHLGDMPEAFNTAQVLESWLNISKVIGRNQLGEWGLAASPNIKVRGIRDYAFLVIRRHGSPLHFSEVAKDKERFVLVGRGLYGLTEWGYTDGVVRDVIIDILKKKSPMQRDELVDSVLKERHVKENTVIVNLQNKKYFKRDDKGNYALA